MITLESVKQEISELVRLDAIPQELADQALKLVTAEGLILANATGIDHVDYVDMLLLGGLNKWTH
jgi:hypothetical protein